jgi:threonine/homoserine/homoserine lactone efflux protein
MGVAYNLVAFTLAAGLLTVTPGVDTALVLRAATLGGSRAGAAAAAGIVVGCLCWGAFVALGLAAVLANSPFGLRLFQWVGAAYLLWVGAGMLLRRRGGVSAPGRPAVSVTEYLRVGLVTNLLNPKVGLFYLTFLPQFVPAGLRVGPFLFLLACIHAALGIGWFAVITTATASLARWLARPHVTVVLDRLTGSVLVAVGIRLVLSRPG